MTIVPQVKIGQIGIYQCFCINCAWSVLGMKSQTNNTFLIGRQWLFAESGSSTTTRSSNFVQRNGLLTYILKTEVYGFGLTFFIYSTYRQATRIKMKKFPGLLQQTGCTLASISSRDINRHSCAFITGMESVNPPTKTVSIINCRFFMSI